jgi:aspartyl-tRNA(Asn)/glutamyl-tRNA(Gln) amidotransferase subunit A
LTVTEAELAYLNLKEIRRMLARKEISSRELVEAQLQRLGKLQPRLNAFITVCAEEALEAARRADEEAAGGRALGALHGIPLTVKDIFWTRGVRTTSGSRILGDFVPPSDSTVVARLRAAGAIFIGKANLHEFAFGVSNLNPHYGAARNPWDTDRMTGGSSGGSAAAVAAGIGYGSMGSDTGGSIRIPSALCGTVGLKPTYGRISRCGVTPLAWSLDHLGPIARSVEDAAILYEIAAGVDPGDPTTSRRAVEPVSETLGAGLPQLRLGVPREYFFAGNTPEVDEAVRAAIDHLTGLGLEAREVSVPEVEFQSTCRNTITFVEAASYHQGFLGRRPQDYGADVREALRIGASLRATDYLAAQRARRAIAAAFRRAFESIDVLATPTTPAAAPRLEQTSLDNGESLRPGLLRLTSPFNTVGFPAISIPCGRTAAGLPVGLQLVARPWHEATLLRVAHRFMISRPAMDPPSP